MLVVAVLHNMVELSKCGPITDQSRSQLGDSPRPKGHLVDGCCTASEYVSYSTTTSQGTEYDTRFQTHSNATSWC